MFHTGRHARMVSDIAGHLECLYWLVVHMDAKEVIECGVRGGHSTVALLEGVTVTGGRLTSVDIDPCVDTRKMVESYNLGAPWTFIKSDDIVFAQAWDRTRPVDLIFIDTSHLYEHTKREIEVFDPILRPFGLMAFHDTMSFHDGVMKPIEEFLKDKSGYHFENYEHDHGFGMLRKCAR